MSDKLTRIAFVDGDRCKPKQCRQECRKSCPVVAMGKMCIEVKPTDKVAFISEELCNGCGICVKKCPFQAISIINLPTDLSRQTTHRYGPNSFKLHRLPTPRPSQILGLVGSNGTGKSTALKILSGKEKPNLGNYDSPPEWSDIITHFRGSELQNYFNRMIEGNLKAIIKPQYVMHIPKVVKGIVDNVINAKCQKDESKETIISQLELNDVLSRPVSKLSGGELQRFAISVAIIQKADVYMFDEPTSFLDVKQRLNVAKVIRSLVTHINYVIVVEHDLSILDYLSDSICLLYGVPGAYGIVTMPFSVREGINIFLDGMLPTENMRFRDESLTFKMVEKVDDKPIKKQHSYSYPSMTKCFNNFKIEISEGEFTDSEIIVLLGQNGTGKTTFIELLAGNLSPDEKRVLPQLSISYKSQNILLNHTISVRQLLLNDIRSSLISPQFQSDVIKPLQIERLYDQEVQHLSGGELQRVALALCLGKVADLYLIDEPSAFLDSEQRIIAAKVIKRFILHNKKTAFIVEHDFIMATYLADRVIVFDGTPSVSTMANSPQSLLSGMNRFLEMLNITFRRDPSNFRPRINKLDSVKDKEQKMTKNFFFLEE